MNIVLELLLNWPGLRWHGYFGRVYLVPSSIFLPRLAPKSIMSLLFSKSIPGAAFARSLTTTVYSAAFNLLSKRGKLEACNRDWNRDLNDGAFRSKIEDLDKMHPAKHETRKKTI